MYLSIVNDIVDENDNNMIVEEIEADVVDDIKQDIITSGSSSTINTLIMRNALLTGVAVTGLIYPLIRNRIFDNQRVLIQSQQLRVQELIVPFFGLASLDLPIDTIREFAPVLVSLEIIEQDLLDELQDIRSIGGSITIPQFIANMLIIGFISTGYSSPNTLIYKLVSTLKTLSNSVIPHGFESAVNSIYDWYYGENTNKIDQEPYLFSEWFNELTGRGVKSTYEYHMKSSESENNPLSFNKTYNWAGPGTNFNKRLVPGEFRKDGYPMPREFSKPINELDELSFKHDMDYSLNIGSKERMKIDDAYIHDLIDILNKPISTTYRADIEQVIDLFKMKRLGELATGNFPDSDVNLIKPEIKKIIDLKAPKVSFNTTDIIEPDEKPFFYSGKKPRNTTKGGKGNKPPPKTPKDETIKMSSFGTPNDETINMPNPRPPKYIKVKKGKIPNDSFLALLIKILGEDRRKELNELSKKINSILNKI